MRAKRLTVQQRKEIFHALVTTQDLGLMTVAQSLQHVMKQFDSPSRSCGRSRTRASTRNGRRSDRGRPAGRRRRCRGRLTAARAVDRREGERGDKETPTVLLVSPLPLSLSSCLHPGRSAASTRSRPAFPPPGCPARRRLEAVLVLGEPVSHAEGRGETSRNPGCAGPRR